MMPIPIIIASQAVVENPTFSDSLPHLVGFVMVVFTLTVLWGICAITGTVLKRSKPAPAAAKPRAATPPVSDDFISPETLAVIAAAVHATAGKERRIVSVKQQNSAWQSAGRQQIQGSHKIR